LKRRSPIDIADEGAGDVVTLLLLSRLREQRTGSSVAIRHPDGRSYAGLLWAVENDRRADQRGTLWYIRRWFARSGTVAGVAQW